MDLKKEQITKFIQNAEKIKKSPEKYADLLKGKTLAMLFEKASTRTRVSFEVAMTQLGGHAIYLDFTTSQLSRGESIEDTAKTLERYVDIIMARLYRHQDILEIAKFTKVPVINGLTDLEHPCQALSDLLTIKEKGKLSKNSKFLFIGDCGFNMANSLMLACAKMQLDVWLSCPKNYPPNQKYLEEASKYSSVTVEHDPKKAIENADIVYTDTWISMGLEEEKAERIKAFSPYQVNENLLKYAKEDAIVMHCLPAHRGLEITNEVIDGKNSVVFDQAENRLHMQKAIILELLQK